MMVFRLHKKGEKEEEKANKLTWNKQLKWF